MEHGCYVKLGRPSFVEMEPAIRQAPMIDWAPEAAHNCSVLEPMAEQKTLQVVIASSSAAAVVVEIGPASCCAATMGCWRRLDMVVAAGYRFARAQMTAID